MQITCELEMKLELYGIGPYKNFWCILFCDYLMLMRKEMLLVLKSFTFNPSSVGLGSLALALEVDIRG